MDRTTQEALFTQPCATIKKVGPFLLRFWNTSASADTFTTVHSRAAGRGGALGRSLGGPMGAPLAQMGRKRAEGLKAGGRI